MAGGSLLLVLLKNFFQRPRPIFEHPLLMLSTYSFPSGHVMGATLFCGSLAFIALSSAQTWRWRILSLLLATGFVILIALTRVYLGVHYLSDVLAAMAAGLAWLAFCLTAVETYRKRPGRKMSAKPSARST
jgi:undecaprenyl-diphosphatase